MLLDQPPFEVGGQAVQPASLQKVEELFEPGEIFFEREVHIEFSVSVVAREGPNTNGKDAVEEFFSEVMRWTPPAT